MHIGVEYAYSCVSSPKRISTKFGHWYNITWGYSATSDLKVHTSSAVSVYGAWFILARIGRFNWTMFLWRITINKIDHLPAISVSAYSYVKQLKGYSENMYSTQCSRPTPLQAHFPPPNDSLTAEVKRTQQCDPEASGISTRIRTLFAHPRLLWIGLTVWNEYYAINGLVQ